MQYKDRFVVAHVKQIAVKEVHIEKLCELQKIVTSTQKCENILLQTIHLCHYYLIFYFISGSVVTHTNGSLLFTNCTIFTVSSSSSASSGISGRWG